MKCMNRINWKKLLRTILTITLIATMLLGCVSVLSGCTSASTNDKDSDKDSGNKDKDKVDKEQYENLSDEEYMQKLEQNNIGGLMDTLTDIYGTLGSFSSGESINQGVEMAVSLQVGDYVLDMLEESYTSSTGSYMDFSFLSRIGLDLDVSMVDELVGYDIALMLANEKIISLSALVNMTSSMVWLAVPELNDTYVKVDVTDMGLDMGSILGSMQNMPDVTGVLPSDEQLSELLNRYLEIALANIKNVTRTATTLELDGLKQDCTEMSVKIYQADAQAVLKAVAQEALEDDDLKEIIENFTDYYNELMRAQYENMGYGSYWQDIELYSSFVEFLEATLEEMEVSDDELDTENYIELITYIDDDHNIIGRKLTAGREGNMHYYTVKEGNAFAFEAVIEDAGFEITGSGTDKSGTVDGEYTLTVQGTDYVVLEVENWKTSGGSVEGTLRIEPTAYLMNKIFGGSNALPFADIALEIKLDMDDQVYMELNLLGNDALVVGLVLEARTSSADDLREPSNAIDLNNQSALMDWVEDMDFDTVFRNMRNAGVPSDLVDLLEEGLDMAMNGGYSEPDYDYDYDYGYDY